MTHITIAEEFLQAVRKSELIAPRALTQFLEGYQPPAETAGATGPAPGSPPEKKAEPPAGQPPAGQQTQPEPVEEAVAMARAMLRQGLLTKYQAEELLRRRGRNLTLDGYQLLYPVGAGGMGRVFAAREIETGYEVAIKFIPEGRDTDPAHYTRFRLEAEAGMRLAHPNILRTFGLKSTEEIYGRRPYVVMELVKGISLRELVDLKKQLPVSQVCDIVVQAAKGLEVAHRAGLVHRDVKPENLLIRSDGSVKVLDFGLAMVDEKDEEFSMAMILGQNRLGTADFVAPEQSINSYEIDCRADIYSLGCALYFGLTGQLPFPAKSIAEKIRGHRSQKAPAIEDLRDNVPPRVVLITRKMMAKRPENRVQSAAEVVTLLEPFAQRLPVEFDFPRLVKARDKMSRLREAHRQRRYERRSSQLGKTSSQIETDIRNNAEEDTQMDESQQSINLGESGADGAV